MAYAGETLLLIEKRVAGNLELYVVVGDRKTDGEEITFLKQDDAFDFARSLLNGGGKIENRGRKSKGGVRPVLPADAIQKRRDFILKHFTEPSTVEALCAAAKKSTDKDIYSTPRGSWSSITSRLKSKKKLGLMHRIGQAGVYKTVTRG